MRWKEVVLLEEAVDDNQAYERKDPFVLSGNITEVRVDADCNDVIITEDDITRGSQDRQRTWSKER